MTPPPRVCGQLGARASSTARLLNRHEARELTHADEQPKALLEALHRLGPKTVVMTDGTHGSYAFDGSVYLRTGVLPAALWTGRALATPMAQR